MAEALDLRGALEQDRLQVLELLETTRRLVLEVQAAHYWTAEALTSFAQVGNIGSNIQQALDDLGPHWHEGKNVFNRPEAVKLYKIAIGLYAALRPVRQKFAEQLDKRRRQRIMGEEFVESPDVSPEQAEADLAQFSERHARLWAQYGDIGEALQAIPAGLLPTGEHIRAAAEAAKNAPAPEARPARDGTIPPPPSLNQAPPADAGVTGQALDSDTNNEDEPKASAGLNANAKLEDAQATPAAHDAPVGGFGSPAGDEPAAVAFAPEASVDREQLPQASVEPRDLAQAALDPADLVQPSMSPVGNAVSLHPSADQEQPEAEAVSSQPGWYKADDGPATRDKADALVLSSPNPQSAGTAAPSVPSGSSGGGSAQATPPPPRRPAGDYRPNAPRITWGGKEKP
jgi:hypothetical protein